MAQRNSRHTSPQVRGGGGGSFDLRQAQDLIDGLALLIETRQNPDQSVPAVYLPTDTSWFSQEIPLAPQEESLQEEEVPPALPPVLDPEPEPVQVQIVLLREAEPETEPVDTLDRDGLLAFARALSTTPLNRGVQSLVIRRLVDPLSDRSGLVATILDGDFDEARAYLVGEHQLLQELVGQADQAILRAMTTSGDPVTEDQTIVSRLRARLALALDPSALNLHRELFLLATDARGKAELLNNELERLDALRAQTIPLERPVTALVAQFSHLWEQREDTVSVKAQLDDFLTRAQSTIEEIHTCITRGRKIAQEIENLETTSVFARTRATKLVTLMRSLITAAQTMGVTVPPVIFEQVREIVEPIETAVSHLAESFRSPETPEIDPVLALAINGINVQKSRLQQLLSPIRPSEFKRRLDRDEELHRLVLIAFHLLTPTRDDKPHEGRGKASGVRVMVEANVIDASEETRALELIVALKDQTPRLLETNQVGRFWRYRPTKDGHAQARAWLRECIDTPRLKERIEKGRKAQNAAFAAARSRTTASR